MASRLVAPEPFRIANDRRPALEQDGDNVLILGVQCEVCGYASVDPTVRCPICRSATSPTRFSPRGAVWSSTIVRIEVQGRAAPYGLVYIDLDDGPRVLAHVDPDVTVAVGDRASIVGLTPRGDCLAVVGPPEDAAP